MIIDLKFDGKRLIKIFDNDYELLEPIKPYFYVIYREESPFRFVKYSNIEGVTDIVDTGFKAIVARSLNRYDIDDSYKVAKVLCTSPKVVPDVAYRFLSSGFRCSAFNVKYLARCSFDLNIEFFDIKPLYYGLDSEIIEKVRKCKVLVIDVEAIEHKPVLCSAYMYKPFEEVRKDDVQHFKLPEEADELQKLINNSTIIAGHNILGFDIPILNKIDIEINTNLKSIVDSSALLANWAGSFQVGSARSLLDVAKTLRDQAGISDEEIELKEKSRGKITKMSFEELVNYNVNDVVITSKLLNIFFTFLAITSGLTQIPLSVIQSTTAGIIAEYFMLHDLENRGIVPEYRKVDWRVSAHKVYIYKENYTCGKILKYDVKAMYPTFVLKHFIDPTLIVDDGGVQEGVTYKLEHNIDTKIRYDLRSGIGALWSTVKKLYYIRKLTKTLKKENPLFENVDKSVKAILNALAYGVQGKRSGYAIFGNVACPVKIFLGTTRILYDVVNKLKEKGIKVVYGDTDSLFIEDRGYDPINLMNEINNILSCYGLEVDYEGSYERGIIITRKSYILIGQDILIKGSKIRSKLKYYLPLCISKKFIEIINADPSERKKIIREIIYSANIEELFANPAQQLWRLISRDPQAVKREIARGKEFVRVRTTWDDVRTIYLKKLNIANLMKPEQSPLIYLLYICKDNTLILSDYEPYYIIDTNYLYIPVEVNVPQICAFGSRGVFLINDKLYIVNISKLLYILEDRYGIQHCVASEKVDSSYNMYTLVAIKGIIRPREIRMDECTFRDIVYRITLKNLEKIFEA